MFEWKKKSILLIEVSKSLSMKTCIQEKIEKTPIGSCCLYKPSIDRVYVVLRPVREYDVNTAREGLQLNVLFVCLLFKSCSYLSSLSRISTSPLHEKMAGAYSLEQWGFYTVTEFRALALKVSPKRPVTFKLVAKHLAVELSLYLF